MRRRLPVAAVGLAAAVALALGGTAAAQGPPQDTVTGSVGFVSVNFPVFPQRTIPSFSIDAASGPTGLGPSGTVTFAQCFVGLGCGEAPGRVTCLAVRGNRATIGVDLGRVLGPNPFPPFILPVAIEPGLLITVVDGGMNPPGGQDFVDYLRGEFQGPSGSPVTSVPTSCPEPSTDPIVPNVYPGFGDVVVHDAPAVPTTRQDCKNGGWRNFPGYRNQGHCVASVVS